MINLIKPGHVLRFGICPSTIVSPAWVGQSHQTAQPWPVGSASLGNVRLIAHPSGPLGEICSFAAGMRSGISASRAMSYSKLGNFVREKRDNQDVQLGTANADFVGYTDGYTNYIPSAGLAFSKDFSGCLMVAYNDNNGVRHVAHAAANANASDDCKQAFLTHLQTNNATLIGWFRPYIAAIDDGPKFNAMTKAMPFVKNDPAKFSTFGIITAANQAYAVTAFKPTSITLTNNDWVVTNVVQRTLNASFTYAP